MRKIPIIIICIVFLQCTGNKKPVLGETKWQKEMNAFFKDATTSPLKGKDRKDFETLEFFKFDSTYVITATLKRTPDSEPFKMKTSTDRLPVYRVYGELDFNLNEKELKLNIYQNVDSEDKDYLFLPFLDDTNGDTSYSGGRYIETSIPEGNIMKIDFNEAFNAYCAYNDKYSCPIVPRANYVPIKIEAGVKAFKKY
ncbi:MAG: DUF1684 domain-containing protein [Flavobacteriaceae bacterium]|nr:DUF1684 domain-containing protein [Bacteroidia bacterium]NNK82501.1 DUF1684 domain-containing protein [Flavobacteriaceae bacterium]